MYKIMYLYVYPNISSTMYINICMNYHLYYYKVYHMDKL